MGGAIFPGIIALILAVEVEIELRNFELLEFLCQILHSIRLTILEDYGVEVESTRFPHMFRNLLACTTRKRTWSISIYLTEIVFRWNGLH